MVYKEKMYIFDDADERVEDGAVVFFSCFPALCVLQTWDSCGLNWVN